MTEDAGPCDVAIDLNKPAIYEAGAVFLTTLLFNEPRDTDETRGWIHQSLCAWAIKERAAQDAEWAAEPAPIKPLYAAVEAIDVNRDINRVNTRMRNRAVAARMGMVFMESARLGTLPSVKPPLKRLSLNQIAEWVLPLSEQAEPGNVETRQWRPSLPVIHLAMALIWLVQLSEKDGRKLDYMDMLWSGDVLNRLITMAQFIEDLILSGQIPKIPVHQLIRVRLVH